MPLTALHSEHGLLDATADELGQGLDWDQIHRARPRPDLRCPACAGPVHAKTSPRGLKFFAHDSAQPHCPNHGESPEHHHLKHALAHARVPQKWWRSSWRIAALTWGNASWPSGGACH